jgi:hypothetical protein
MFIIHEEYRVEYIVWNLKTKYDEPSETLLMGLLSLFQIVSSLTMQKK